MITKPLFTLLSPWSKSSCTEHGLKMLDLEPSGPSFKTEFKSYLWQEAIQKHCQSCLRTPSQEFLQHWLIQWHHLQLTTLNCVTWKLGYRRYSYTYGLTHRYRLCYRKSTGQGQWHKCQGFRFSGKMTLLNFTIQASQISKKWDCLFAPGYSYTQQKGNLLREVDVNVFSQREGQVARNKPCLVPTAATCHQPCHPPPSSSEN